MKGASVDAHDRLVAASMHMRRRRRGGARPTRMHLTNYTRRCATATLSVAEGGGQ